MNTGNKTTLYGNEYSNQIHICACRSLLYEIWVSSNESCTAPPVSVAVAIVYRRHTYRSSALSNIAYLILFP